MKQSLALEHDLNVFSANQHDRFLSFLESVEKNTIVFQLDSTNQVMLGSDLTTVSVKSRLTWTALRQCCNYLSKSFYTTISDLCGRSFTNKSDMSMYSNQDAIVVFNTVLKRRFDKGLSGKKIIKNSSSNTIEAVLGDKYRRLSNHLLINKAEHYLKRLGYRYEFSQAVISGRRLQARYVFEEPIPLSNFSTNIHFDPVKAGVLFTNSEYGDSSLKMTLFISFGSLGTTLLPYSASWCLDHKGVNFNDKLNSLLVDIEKKRTELDEHNIEAMLIQLQQSNLGLSGNKETDDKWLKTLNKKLSAQKLNSSVVDKVMQRTLFSRVEEGNVVLARVDKAKVWPDKSALDMFVALLAEGSSSVTNMAVRDNIEQSSFKLLSGKMRL